MSDEGYRAGALSGGYSGGYYMDNYQTSANAQRVYDSEFSRASAVSRAALTTQNNVQSRSVQGRNIVPAVNYTQY